MPTLTPIDSGYYEFFEPLGRGAFGVVYRGQFFGSEGFTKEVAIKVLNGGAAEQAEVVSRLRDEARVLGLLRHRAIVKVDGLIRVDGRWAVVMEYVDGADLATLVKRCVAPVGCALELAAEVAGALHAAWTQPGPDGKPLRLLHRDIKPSNLRLTRWGEVKVLDFGISRADFGSRESKTESLMLGTPDYMAPERFDMQDGPAADVYALAVVIVEMLSGASIKKTSPNPDRHRDTLARVRAALSLTQVDEDVSALLLCALAYEPDARPSAEQLERACLRLRARHPDEQLRLWSSSVIAGLRAESAVTTVDHSQALTQLGPRVLVPAPPGPNYMGAVVPAIEVPLLGPGDLRLAITPPKANPRSTPAAIAPPVAPELKDQIVELQRQLRIGAIALLLLLFGSLALVYRGGALPATQPGEGGSASGSSGPSVAPTVKLDAPPIVTPADPNPAPTPTPPKGATPPQGSGGMSTPGGRSKGGGSGSASSEGPVVVPPPADFEEELPVEQLKADPARPSSRTLRDLFTNTSGEEVQVIVTGDATMVELRRTGQAAVALPGRAAPGRYTIWAGFRDLPLSAMADPLVVSGTRAVEINCARITHKCVEVK